MQTLQWSMFFFAPYLVDLFFSLIIMHFTQITKVKNEAKTNYSLAYHLLAQF